MKWIEVLIGTRGDGKSLSPGGIYEISDEDADILIRNGRAKLAIPKQKSIVKSKLTEASFEKKNAKRGRPKGQI